MQPLLLKAARGFPAVLLTGARQAGKTALVTRAFPKARYLTLDVSAVAEQAEKAPSALLASEEGAVILDEVQYAPSLFRSLKVEIDKRRTPGRFLLTGSQNFLMMKGVTESLAGRCAVLQLYPLGLTELRPRLQATRLDTLDAILSGGYPPLWADPELDRVLWFSSYLATYLERDVRNLLNVGNLRDFERFLRAAAIRTGQILSYSDLARDVGVAVSTARAWLSVLEASHQVFLLEPYFRNLGRRLVKSPKLYLTDTGFACFLCGIATRRQLLDSPLLGALWETLVVNQALRSVGASGGRPPLWYWRTREGREIDLVFDRGGRLSLAEAKFTENPGPGDAKGLVDFISRVKGARVEKAEIVCRVERSYPMEGGIRAVNVLGWDAGAPGSSPA